MREINVPDWDENADKNPLLANIPTGERKVIAELFKLTKMISDSGIGENNYTKEIPGSEYKVNISPVFANNAFDRSWPNAFHINIENISLECLVIDAKTAHNPYKYQIANEMRRLTGDKNKTEPDSGYMLRVHVRKDPSSPVVDQYLMIDIMNNNSRSKLETTIRGYIREEQQKTQEQERSKKQVNAFKYHFGL